MRSLRARLFGVWVLSLAASVAVGLLLVQLYRQSGVVLQQQAEAELTQACERISDRYSYYASGWTGPVPADGDAALQRDLDAVVTVALAASPGLAGGILRDPAAADPVTDMSQVAAAALAGNGTSLDETQAANRTQILFACRLSGPVPDLAAWVGTEIAARPGSGQLQVGLGVLMALMLGLSAGLTWLVSSWARQVRRIEAALARHDSAGLPRIAPTGEAELDRIAEALNSAGTRLLAAQAEAEAAQARAASAERLAALGRVAAGVAHEIRNPIAAMRLRAEGALALEGDAALVRGRVALGAILGQIDRLDRLSGELLVMTQRQAPSPERVALAGFLAECAAEHAGVRVAAAAGEGWFDPAMIRRALDNLVQNALRHAPEGGVMVRVVRAAGMLRFEVEDNGPGVPEALRETLFEPFVTGRADGTGLGLAIAREMAQAHGGTLALAPSTSGDPKPGAGGDPKPGAGGAVFVLEIPQP